METDTMLDNDRTKREREQCLANPWQYLETCAGAYPSDPDADSDVDPWPDDSAATRDSSRVAVSNWLALDMLDDCPYNLIGAVRRAELPDHEAFDDALREVAAAGARGVFLWGGPYIGKTLCAASCLAVYALVNRHDREAHKWLFEPGQLQVSSNLALWVEGDEFKMRASSARTLTAWREMREELGRVPILVLDDINHTCTDNAAEMLLAVMRMRLDTGLGRITIVTSNFSGKEIAKRNRALASVIERFRKRLIGIQFMDPNAPRAKPRQKFAKPATVPQ